MTMNLPHVGKIRLKRINVRFNPIRVDPYLLPILMLLKMIIRMRSKQGWIEIEGMNMYVLDKQKSTEHKFNINDLNDFRVYFVNNPLIESTESYNEEELKQRHSRITFSFNKINYEFFYWSRKKELLEILNYWYEEGVEFKEYCNGRRVYLGRQPTYSDIQVLKKLHNFEW